MRSLTAATFIAVISITAGCGGDYGPPAGPDAGPDAEQPAPPSPVLPNAEVVCSTCSADLLAAKTAGIRQAMTGLVAFAGADALPGRAPITFHLDGDPWCGQYQTGTTGFFFNDSAGHGHICLFDVEKQNRALAFTPENAVKPEDQLLPVHEALHAWSSGRIDNYGIEEPFCKITSFVISGAMNAYDPDPCAWFRGSDYPDRLMTDLCALGMTGERASETLKLTAASSAVSGRDVTSAEFAGIVSGVLGRDATPAFQAAGILP